MKTKQFYEHIMQKLVKKGKNTDFGRSVNPISTRRGGGAHSPQPVLRGPPDFSDLTTALYFRDRSPPDLNIITFGAAVCAVTFCMPRKNER